MLRRPESRGGVPPARRDVLLITAILIIVDAAAAWALITIYYPARRDEAFARAQAQLSLLARDRQNALAGWAGERLSDAALTASLLRVNGTTGAQDLLDHFIRAYGYEAAYVIDDRGTVLLRRGSDDFVAEAAVSFAQTPPGRSGAWIDFRRTANRAPVVFSACRFGDGTVVFASDPTRYVYPLFSTVTVASRTGETNLVGLHDGWGIGLTPYRSGAPPPMTVRVPIPRDRAAMILARGEQTIRIIDRNGKACIGVAKVIPRAPWVVFAKIDEAEAADVAIGETVRLARLFAFGSVMIAAAAFFILRSRRVQKLRAAEDRLARVWKNTTTGIIVMRVLFDEKDSPADHQLIEMNPAAEELLGVTAAAEIGKRSADAPYLQWPEEIRARNYEVALTGSAIQYEHYDPASQRWFDTSCFSLRHGQFAQILTDVTPRKISEHAVRNLSARLLRVQDDTRRRVARELHETVAQSLAGLRMNLGILKRGGGALPIIEDSISIVDGALTEVRTMSYLLHPAMIDQAGLLTTLRWYVDGFQQRSGIATTLDAPDDVGRLSRDLETSVFRIVQESLTNVQRHSGSTTAHLSVERMDGSLVVEIADRGHGLPAALRNDRNALLASGVGIAGINERVHELRGELTIESSEGGTKLRVTLPMTAA